MGKERPSDNKAPLKSKPARPADVKTVHFPQATREPRELEKNAGGKDFAWSKKMAFCAPLDLPRHFVVLRWICRLLEYSGHGVPWFIITIAQVSVSIRWEAVEFWTNMVWGKNRSID
jgi:hypothetical protein